MRIYILTLILLIAGILSLAACAGAGTKSQGVAPEDLPDVPLCDCRPYPRPSPISILPIDPVNAGPDIWQMDNQSYLNNAAVWAQFERYMQESEAALNYWYKCVAACNLQYQEINQRK